MVDASEHLGIAFMAAKKSAAMEGVSIEDSEAFGDACVALCRCAERFEPERGFQFSTFAVSSCLNAVTSGWLHRTGRRRQNFSRINFVSPEDAGDIPDHRQSDTERLEIVDHVRDAIAGLTERQRFVIEQRMAGRLFGEIAESLGVTKQRVQQIEAQAHEALSRSLSYLVST